MYLARDVSLADGEAHAAEGEEAGMETAWVPLDDLLEGVLARRFHNPSLSLGVLALVALRARGWAIG
jgi:ADP-ribose pyrophosphatase